MELVISPTLQQGLPVHAQPTLPSADKLPGETIPFHTGASPAWALQLQELSCLPAQGQSPSSPRGRAGCGAAQDTLLVEGDVLVAAGLRAVLRLRLWLARQEGLVARGLLRVPHLQRLLRVQVQRHRDGWQDADVPEGDRDTAQDWHQGTGTGHWVLSVPNFRCSELKSSLQIFLSEVIPQV